MRILLFLCLVLAVVNIQPKFAFAEDPPLLWASIGAATRAFPFLQGIANQFAQAGLISKTSCRFKSIAGGSSAAWFLTQLFFSQPYFERTIHNDTQVLYDFVIQWIEAYGHIWNVPGDIFDRGFNSALADILRERGIGLPFFYENMLEITTQKYGDPGWSTRQATPANRVQALQNTEMMIASSFHPTFRVRTGTDWMTDSLTYIGPGDEEDAVFTTPIAYQFATKNNGTMFYTGVKDSQLPLKTCVTRKANRFFKFEDWNKFPLYPRNRDSKGSLLMSKSVLPTCLEVGKVNEPFGGQAPSALQAAIISSSSWAEYTSLAPTSFAQTISVEKYRATFEPSLLQRLRKQMSINNRAKAMYRLADRFWRMGLCFQDRPSETPNNCGPHDPQFSHHAVLDGATLPMQIAQHQVIDGKGTTGKLKVIQTIPGITPRNFLAYFGTYYNEGVAPGDYLWRPNGGFPVEAPWSSLQVFEDRLDEHEFDMMRNPVGQDTYISTVELFGFTTIENPAMHVLGGQTVDILVIIADKDFPLTSNVAAPGEAKQVAEEYAQMAQIIATSSVLLDRINAFIAMP